MSTAEIQLAEAVARMLNAEDVSPEAEFAFVPTVERADIDPDRLFVVPGGLTSEVIDRSGRRKFERSVLVGLVAACRPDQTERVKTLLDICKVVGELLATGKPLDEDDEPMRVHCLGVDQEPLFDAERLLGGVFLGVMTARYSP